MVSAPSGTGAPVKMRTVSPGPTVPSNDAPAGTLPIWRSVTGGSATSAARAA